MSTVEVELDTGQHIQWTVIHTQPTTGNHVEIADEGPLLVAMQPQFDIPAVEMGEIVVVTEGTETVETVVQDPMQIVTLAEEVIESAPYGSEEVVELEVETIEEIGQAARLSAYAGNGAYAYSKVKGEAALPKGAKTNNSGIRRGLGKGTLASAKAPPVSSSEESESESQSDDDESKTTPKKREFAHRLQWRDRDMLEALRGVQERKMTIRGAAKRFGVPYSTLKDRVHGRVRHGVKPGVKTALSPEEEDELVKYVRDMEVAGFQLRYIDVRDRAGELLRLNHGHNSPYRDNSPGHNWLAGFLKRHPGLEFKRPSNRSSLPSLAKQKQMLRKYFDIAAHVYKRYRLGHKSERIFSVSETTLNSFPTLSPITLIMAASADGTVLPPFVVFKGTRLALAPVREVYPEAAFACSYDGQVNEDIFLWWFRDHFLRRALTFSAGSPSSSAGGSTNRKPSVLHLSRWAADVTLQLAQRAKEERVSLVSVPPGVAHLVLPLDVGVAAGLEAAAARAAERWQTANSGATITHRICAHLLHKVWRKAIGAERVTLNFARNGLFPLNSAAITPERIFTAAQTMRALPSEPEDDGDHTPAEDDPDALSGLSLLSALSSHEYASLEYGVRDAASAAPANTPLTRGKRRLVKLEADANEGEIKLVRSLLQQQLEAALPEKRSRVETSEVPLTLAMSEASAKRERVSHAVDSILNGQPVVVEPQASEEIEEAAVGDAEIILREMYAVQKREEEVISEEVVIEEIIDQKETNEEQVIIEDQEVMMEEEGEESEAQEGNFIAVSPQSEVVMVDAPQPASSGGKWMDVFSRFLRLQPAEEKRVFVPDSVLQQCGAGDGVVEYEQEEGPVVMEECVVEYVSSGDAWDGVEETV